MKTNLFLIRHSDAVLSSIDIKDKDRELTKHGEDKIKKAATTWKKFLHLDVIVTSPYTRSMQTAKFIAEIFECMDKVIIDKRLSCGSNTEDIIEIANSLNVENIAFVGHQPDLSEHVSAFISSNGTFVDFKKAAIAKIIFNNKVREGKGVLEYLIPPSAII